MDGIIPNIPVSMPSRLFTMPRKFGAIFGGRIYIGEIDTDPTIPSNQIQVFLENEDGSHVPVAQPLLINAGGYPVYNGQVAKFVTEQGYSMAVYDALNVQQFYFPNLSPPTAGDRFGSVADVQAANIPSSTKYINVDGYYGAGDGGAANYKQVASEPTHAGKIQSADGNWWEIIDNPVNPLQFGAKGDGTTLDGLACSNAVLTGRALVLPSGKTFLIDGYSLIPVTGQKISGPGKLTKTATTDGAGGNGSYTNPLILIDGVTDVVVEGVSFFMPSGARRIAIAVHNSSRINIRNNYSLGNENFCFIWKLSNQVNVINNYIYGGAFGVATGGYYDTTTGSGSNTDGFVTAVNISGNFITGCASEAVDINWDTVRSTVSNNIMIANNIAGGEEAIDIGGGACVNILVEGNIIRGGGIGSDAIGVTVKLNTPGCIINGNSISGLDTNNTSGCGIKVYYQSINTVITNNYINTASSGIAVYGESHSTIIANNIIENINKNGVAIGGDGLLINNISVKNNTIRNTGVLTTVGNLSRCGIIILDSSRCDVVNNKIITVGSIGIYVANSNTKPNISGNAVAGTMGRGVDILAPDCTVSGNKLDSCGTAALGIAALRTLVSNNTFTNNSIITPSFAVIVSAGSTNLNMNNNTIFDGRATPIQSGLQFAGVSDRCIITSNIIYNNVVNEAGTGSLTNSVVANNITS
ncbi:phage tailspike protein [Yersinia aleksiciae]|uniref:phage tailspike protein n=1 Tax=Yersinia aleksiciae TaxID=263819 RepID=UPI0025AB5320|nr:phage tailspike protein [Yersinia aleksiciae]MDN0121873.1 phage tailspike protein [Yersinia aleksiciae]